MTLAQGATRVPLKVVRASADPLPHGRRVQEVISPLQEVNSREVQCNTSQAGYPVAHLPAWKEIIGPLGLEIYKRAGYQRSFGFGKQPALIVIDVEYNFTGDDPEEPILESIAKFPNSCGEAAWGAIPHIKRLIAQFRARQFPIVYTHGYLTPETVRVPRVGTEIVDELMPLPGELVLEKRGASAFFGTNLARWLEGTDVDTIVHVGAVTSGCVRASVVDAAALGYKNLVPEECVFDRALVPHLVNLFDMDAKYADVITVADVEVYLGQLEPKSGRTG